jgi:hypothetical protein
MKIENLPRAPLQPNGSAGPRALNPLVFNSFDDTPDNPRPGLGYQQLFDRTRPVTLTAKLPDVTRVGDTVELFWDDDDDDDDDVPVQTYKLDQATIDKGWLSFSVSVDVIKAPLGKVHYTLFDHEAQDLQTSDTRTVKVNRNVPGGLDPDTDTAINEGLTAASVSPSVIENAATPPITVTVPAWLHMETGDELVVLWNGIRVSAPVLTQAGVGVPQVVSIPEDVVKQGGSSEKLPVNYEIRDIVDNFSLPSPPTYVAVNVDRDALAAPRVQEANQATLVLDLEALGDGNGHVLIPAFIGDGTSYTVTLEWVGKTPTTEIRLTLDPQTVADPGFDHATFVIPNADLKDLAGGSAVVRYSLVQTGATKLSKTTSITLTGLPVQLAALELIGATAGVIDLGVVTGDPLIVSAPAYVGQKAGDRILLSWAGTSATGGSVNYPDEYTVQAGEEAEEVYFEVPRQNLEPLGGGTLQLSYQVVRAGGGTQNSPVTTYDVTAVALVFPAPVIVQAPGGVLSPMGVQAGGTFRVTYTGMRDTDIIVPIWNKISDTIPWMNGKPGGVPPNTVESTVPAALIGAVIGKTIDVVYDVLREGQGYFSDVLKLTVEAIPLASLPTPQITQASGGVLDVGALQGDADLTVQPWPFIAVGQKMWMRLEGSNNLDLPAWQEYEITSTGTQSTKVPLGYLEGLADASTLRLVLKVSFDAGLTQQVFPMNSYQVTTTPTEITPTIISVVGSDGIEIPDGTETTQTNGRISGIATQSYKVKLFEKNLELITLNTDPSGSWTTEWGTYSAGTNLQFQAKTIDGGLTSAIRKLQIIEALTSDYTDFNDRLLNGWEAGPASAQGDWSIASRAQGEYSLNNFTYSERSAGVVLKKRFNNMKSGQRYRFQLYAQRDDHGQAVPQISIGTNLGELSAAVTLNNTWQLLSGTVLATSQQLEFQIISHVATGHGNDYWIDNISISKV